METPINAKQRTTALVTFIVIAALAVIAAVWHVAITVSFYHLA